MAKVPNEISANLDTVAAQIIPVHFAQSTAYRNTLQPWRGQRSLSETRHPPASQDTASPMYNYGARVQVDHRLTMGETPSGHSFVGQSRSAAPSHQRCSA